MAAVRSAGLLLGQAHQLDHPVTKRAHRRAPAVLLFALLRQLPALGSKIVVLPTQLSQLLLQRQNVGVYLPRVVAASNNAEHSSLGRDLDRDAHQPRTDLIDHTQQHASSATARLGATPDLQHSGRSLREHRLFAATGSLLAISP